MADGNNNASRIYEVGQSSSSGSGSGSGRRYPPGIRFVPTDQELILAYLQPKINGSALPDNCMHDADVYHESPAYLTERYQPHDNKQWYFLTASRKKIYANGNRPARSAGYGFWKTTGSSQDIKCENEVIGFKRSLNYHIGRHKKSIKTDWIMHEYRVKHPSVCKKKKNEDKLDEYILCRLYINEKGNGKKSSSNATEDPKTNGGDDETLGDGVDRKGKGKRSKSKDKLSKVMDGPVINGAEDETPRKRRSPNVINDPVMSGDNLIPNAEDIEQPLVQSYNYLNNHHHQMISSNDNNQVVNGFDQNQLVENCYNHSNHYPTGFPDVPWNFDNDVNNVAYDSLLPSYSYPNGVVEVPNHGNLEHFQTYVPPSSRDEYNGCLNYGDDTNVLMAGMDDSYAMVQQNYRVSSLTSPSPAVNQMMNQQIPPLTVNQNQMMNQQTAPSTVNQKIEQQTAPSTVNQKIEQQTAPPASYPMTHSNQVNQAQTNPTDEKGNWPCIRRSSSGLRAFFMSQLTAFQSMAQ